MSLDYEKHFFIKCHYFVEPKLSGLFGTRNLA